MAVTLSPLAQSNNKPNQPGAGDIALYRAEIERIHAGESYYSAANTELRGRGYPTRSIFNWRTPVLIWLLGKLPAAELGKAVLGGLALMLFGMGYEVMARQRPKRSSSQLPWEAVVCGALLTGPLMLCILGNLFVMPVLWGGVLIAISLCAYGLDRPGWAVGFGLTALLARELALPYCLLCMLLAWHAGHRRELTAWACGLAGWLLFFAFHAWQVGHWIQPGDRAHSQGWLQWGGAGFVLSTAQINAYLLLLPQWLTALYFVAALAGFAGWNTPVGRRFGLTASIYVIALAFIGHPFNQYWGAMTAPLWCVGAARFPASVRDLWRVVRSPVAA